MASLSRALSLFLNYVSWNFLPLYLDTIFIFLRSPVQFSFETNYEIDL